jgi:hypothetical protein
MPSLIGVTDALGRGRWGTPGSCATGGLRYELGCEALIAGLPGG